MSELMDLLLYEDYESLERKLRSTIVCGTTFFLRVFAYGAFTGRMDLARSEEL